MYVYVALEVHKRKGILKSKPEKLKNTSLSGQLEYSASHIFFISYNIYLLLFKVKLDSPNLVIDSDLDFFNLSLGCLEAPLCKSSPTN